MLIKKTKHKHISLFNKSNFIFLINFIVFFYTFICKNYKVISNRYKNFLLYYKQFCDFRYPITTFYNKFSIPMQKFFIKSYKTYFKLSLLHETRILYYQWGCIYKKNLNTLFDNFLFLNKKATVSFESYLLLKISNIILFNFTQSWESKSYLIQNNQNLNKFNKINVNPISIKFQNQFLCFKNISTNIPLYKNLYKNFSFKNLKYLDYDSVIKKSRLSILYFKNYRYRYFLKKSKIFEKKPKPKPKYRVYVKKETKEQVSIHKNINAVTPFNKIFKKIELKKKHKFVKLGDFFFRFDSDKIKKNDNKLPVVINSFLVSFLLSIEPTIFKNYRRYLKTFYIFKDTISKSKIIIPNNCTSVSFFNLFTPLKKSRKIIYFKKKESFLMNLRELFVIPHSNIINDSLDLNYFLSKKDIADMILLKLIPVEELAVKNFFKILTSKEYNTNDHSPSKFKLNIYKKQRWSKEEYFEKIEFDLLLPFYEILFNESSSLMLLKEISLYEREDFSIFKKLFDDLRYNFEYLFKWNIVKYSVPNKFISNFKNLVLNEKILNLAYLDNFINVPALNLKNLLFYTNLIKKSFNFNSQHTLIAYYKKLQNKNPLVLNLTYNIFLKSMIVKNQLYENFVNNRSYRVVKNFWELNSKRLPRLEDRQKLKDRYIIKQELRDRVPLDNFVFNNRFIRTPHYRYEKQILFEKIRENELMAIKKKLRESEPFKVLKFFISGNVVNYQKELSFPQYNYNKKNLLFLSLRFFKSAKNKFNIIGFKTLLDSYNQKFRQPASTDLLKEKFGVFGSFGKQALEEFCKYYSTKHHKKNRFYYNLIKKVPIIVSPYPLFINNVSIDLNPILIKLYKNEDPLTCFIPENLSIFHIFINPLLIKKFIKKNPIQLLRKILIKNKQESSRCLYWNISKFKLFSKKFKLSFNDSLNFKNVLFNVDLFTFIRNNLSKMNNSIKKILSVFPFNINDFFIDNTSKFFFRNFKVKKLLKFIISSNCYKSKLTNLAHDANFLDEVSFFYEDLITKNFNNNYYYNYTSYKDILLTVPCRCNFFFKRIFKDFIYNNIFIDKKLNLTYDFEEYKLSNNDKFIIKTENFFYNHRKFKKLIKKTNGTFIFKNSNKFFKFFKKNSNKNKNKNFIKLNLSFKFSHEIDIADIDPFIINLLKRFNTPRYKLESLFKFEKYLLTEAFTNPTVRFFKNIEKRLKKNENFFKNLSVSSKEKIFDLILLFITIKLKKRLYEANTFSQNTINIFIYIFFYEPVNDEYLKKILGSNFVHSIRFIFLKCFFSSFLYQIHFFFNSYHIFAKSFIFLFNKYLVNFLYIKNSYYNNISLLKKLKVLETKKSKELKLIDLKLIDNSIKVVKEIKNKTIKMLKFLFPLKFQKLQKFFKKLNFVFKNFKGHTKKFYSKMILKNSLKKKPIKKLTSIFKKYQRYLKKRIFIFKKSKFPLRHKLIKFIFIKFNEYRELGYYEFAKKVSKLKRLIKIYYNLIRIVQIKKKFKIKSYLCAFINTKLIYEKVLININTLRLSFLLLASSMKSFKANLTLEKILDFRHSSFVNKTGIWYFSFLFLVKTGFLNFIAKTSSFLNSLHFFTLKHRLNLYFLKFWNDRGFFLPLELPLYKFFFLYYSNFFFNFFETSTFLNFNSFYNKIQQSRYSSFNRLFFKNDPLLKKSKTALTKFKPKLRRISEDLFKLSKKSAIWNFESLKEHRQEIIEINKETYNQILWRLLMKEREENEKEKELAKLEGRLPILKKDYNLRPYILSLASIIVKPFWRNFRLNINVKKVWLTLGAIVKFSKLFSICKSFQKIKFQKWKGFFNYAIPKGSKKFNKSVPAVSKFAVIQEKLKRFREIFKQIKKNFKFKKKLKYNKFDKFKEKSDYRRRPDWPQFYFSRGWRLFFISKILLKYKKKFTILNLNSLKTANQFLNELSVNTDAIGFIGRSVSSMVGSYPKFVITKQITKRYKIMYTKYKKKIINHKLFRDVKKYRSSLSIKLLRFKKFYLRSAFKYFKKWGLKKKHKRFFFLRKKSIFMYTNFVPSIYHFYDYEMEIKKKRKREYAKKDIERPVFFIKTANEHKFNFFVNFKFNLKNKVYFFSKKRKLYDKFYTFREFRCNEEGRVIKRIKLKAKHILKKRKGHKERTMVLKKTLSFFSSKSRYASTHSVNRGFTDFFSTDKEIIDYSNLFNYSSLFANFSSRQDKSKIQNIFFKNKVSNNNQTHSFENYFFKSHYLKNKKSLTQINYIVKKPTFVFKMKPGYKVLWRSYRKEFNAIMHLNFFRQRRLTDYFLNFKKTNTLLLLRNFEFSIFSIIKRSTFFLDYTLSLVCFDLGMVYLNGKKILNKTVQVYVSDRVQIAITFSYLLQFKWFFFYLNLRRVKFLNKYMKYFFNIKNTILALRKLLISFSKKLFKKLLYCGNDIPNYLEVDFFTMLATIVYEPFLFYEFDPMLIYRIPFLSMRLYNWKYVN